MADLWVVMSVVAFFGLCALLVRGCDRIIGPDDASDLDELATPDEEDMTAEVVR
jgi:hypothetical protein